ncbi:hypothetical protein KKG61_07860 [bacterium]|nr:hypothetical protein [bacterium]MBU1599999.1 hypothetical protein [bacterium]
MPLPLIILMGVVGFLFIVDIIRHWVRYNKTREKKDVVSIVIMFVSFIFWAISITMMIQERIK